MKGKDGLVSAKLERQRRMKIFLDTADIEDIQKWIQTGVVDGITTNPTLLARQNVDPRQHILKICEIVGGRPVSVEVTEKEPEKVYKQALKITELADNIVVKIPCHKDYYSVIQKLVKQGIKLNITLVFTMLQSLLMCKLGVDYISPFIGRLDDIDQNGSALIEEIRIMMDQYVFLNTQILAASVRHEQHIHNAALAGADVVTVPTKVLQKATEHELTGKGIKLFLDDWQKLNITKFP